MRGPAVVAAEALLEPRDNETGHAACYALAAQGVSVSGDRTGLPPLRLVVSVTSTLAADNPADPMKAPSRNASARILWLSRGSTRWIFVRRLSK